MVCVLPVTDEVIDRVNQLGQDQKQPAICDGRLLFEWHPGIPFVQGEFPNADDLFAQDIQDDEIVIPDPLMEEEDDTNIMDATNIATDEGETSAGNEEDSHNHDDNPEFLVEQESGDSSIFASDDSESESDDSESESDVENESDDSESIGHWESYSEDLDATCNPTTMHCLTRPLKVNCCTQGCLMIAPEILTH
jgi:Nucleic-acid-binding protein possibly involved in ribosomal biogenesis